MLRILRLHLTAQNGYSVVACWLITDLQILYLTRIVYRIESKFDSLLRFEIVCNNRALAFDSLSAKHMQLLWVFCLLPADIRDLDELHL